MSSVGSATAFLAARLRLSRCAAVSGREGWRSGGARRSCVATWWGRRVNSGPVHGQSKPQTGLRKAEAAAARPEQEAAGGRARGGGGGGSLRWWRRCCRHPQSRLHPAPANCSGGRALGCRRAKPARNHPCVAPYLLLRRPQPVTLLKVCRVVLLAVPLHPAQPWRFVDRRGLSRPDGQVAGGESTIWRRLSAERS